ncbi:MAG: amidohydrolase family protein [Verrucomicrobia bacterium]|nr:amidohydrolase family protein [Verrucomicrobiota bacterium]
MRVIDVHTHPVMFKAGLKPAEVRWLVAHGRSLGITRMVGLGDVLLHGRNFTAEQIVEVNDDSARVQRLAPDYFRFFCFLNPRLGERAVMREVERCVERHGFIGLKLEICNNARDACMRPVMQAARRWRLPVLQHSWSQTNLRQRSFHTDPADTALLARRHPDVAIIMAHLTGCGVRGVLEARGLPNLYVDTSGGLPEAGLVEFAVEHLGAERVLHGSDLPFRSAGVAIERIKGAKLTPAQQRMILHDNAARLLNLG